MEPLLDWVTQYGYAAVFALQMLGMVIWGHSTYFLPLGGRPKRSQPA